jgi:hypothetical protein
MEHAGDCMRAKVPGTPVSSARHLPFQFVAQGQDSGPASTRAAYSLTVSSSGSRTDKVSGL